MPTDTTEFDFHDIPVFGREDVKYLGFLSSEGIDKRVLEVTVNQGTNNGADVLAALKLYRPYLKDAADSDDNYRCFSERVRLALAHYKLLDQVYSFSPELIARPIGLYINKLSLGVLTERVRGLTFHQLGLPIKFTLDQYNAFLESIRRVGRVYFDCDSFGPHNLMYGYTESNKIERILMVDIELDRHGNEDNEKYMKEYCKLEGDSVYYGF